MTDERLSELSGLVADGKGFTAIADGSENDDRLRLFHLDASCKTTDVSVFSTIDPYDPEDLGRTKDGAYWVADFGDNERVRDTIALHKIASDLSRATKYRMSYPDGEGKHDAEALLMQPNGTPVVVTKDGPTSGVYVPTGALDSTSPTPLRRVGDITLSATGTAGGPAGAIGQTWITGGAVSPDGKRAMIRTYTDAYEWDVTGDIANALTTTAPRRTPLPNEPLGEAIAYAPDGKTLITASEGASGGNARMWRHTPMPATKPVSLPPRATGGQSFVDRIGLRGIKIGIGLLGVVGVVVAVVGVFGIRRARRLGRLFEATGRGVARVTSGRGRARPAGRRDPDDANVRGGTPVANVDTVFLPKVSARTNRGRANVEPPPLSDLGQPGGAPPNVGRGRASAAPRGGRARVEPPDPDGFSDLYPPPSRGGESYPDYPSDPPYRDSPRSPRGDRYP